MSEQVTLFFRRRPTQLGQIVLDASVREQHGVKVDVTSNPVESGSAISDHRRVQPRQVTIEGIITNTPLAGPNDASGPQLAPDGTTMEGRAQIDPKRASDAYRALIDLAKSSELVTITTHLDVYENMTMTSLDVPRDRPIENLRFTATFLEIRIVKNAQVTVSRIDRGRKLLDEHKKPPKVIAEFKVERSFAKILADKANGTPEQSVQVQQAAGSGLPLIHLVGF